MTYGIAILINCLQLSEESRKYFPHIHSQFHGN